VVQPLVQKTFDIAKRTATYVPNSLDDEYVQRLPVLSLNKRDFSQLINPLTIPQGRPNKRRLPDEVEALLQSVDWDDKETQEVFLWEPLYTELVGTPATPARGRDSTLPRDSVMGRESSSSVVGLTAGQVPTAQEWEGELMKTFQRAAGMDREWVLYLLHVAQYELRIPNTHLTQRFTARYLWLRRKLSVEQRQALLSESAALNASLPDEARKWKTEYDRMEKIAPSQEIPFYPFRNVRNPNAPAAKPVSVLPVIVEPTMKDKIAVRVAGPQLFQIQRMLDGTQFVALQTPLKDGSAALEIFTGNNQEGLGDEMVLYDTHTVVDARPYKQNLYATLEVRDNSVAVRNIPVAVEAVHHGNRHLKDMKKSVVLE
jgi:hypothetical protein